MKRIITIGIVLIVLLAMNIMAGVPQMINYQGRLTDPTGHTVPNNIYALNFAIYSTSSTSSSLWTSGFIPTQVTDGLFTSLLGSTNPLPDSLMKYDSLWLGIAVNLDPEITPRTRLTSVNFALKSMLSENALRSEKSDSAEFAEQSHHAEKSDSAGFAEYSLRSDSASFSATAMKSDSSKHAFFADTSGFALDMISSGIAFAQSSISREFPYMVWTNVLSLAINVPADGYLQIMTCGELSCPSSGGAFGVCLDTTAIGGGLVSCYIDVGSYSTKPIFLMHVIPITAGVHHIYVNVQTYLDYARSASIGSRCSAVFYPAGY